MSRSVLLAGAVRTPVGSFNGALVEVPASILGGKVVEASLHRSRMPSNAVNEVVFGNVISAGQGQNIARQAAMAGGLRDTVCATTVNMVCGSGLKTVMMAAQAIRCDDAEVVVAGGTENMSRAPYVLEKARCGYRLGHGELVDTLLRDGLWCAFGNRHMGKLADQVSFERGYTREELDDFAVTSYQRALQSMDNGFFAREIVPVEVKTKKGSALIDRDEEPTRFDEHKMRELRPAFGADGVTTAGNASSINDGAAAVTVLSEVAAKRCQCPVSARVVAYASVACEPEHFTLAPIGAVHAVLDRAGLRPDQIDIFEINEAFSIVPLAVMRDLGVPHSKVNPFGGAVALGHPIGASGARVLVTLLNGLAETGGRYGLVSLCIGGGEAVAMVIERVTHP